MPKITNPVIRAKLKNALIEGKSPRKAALIAGLAPNTAHTATKRQIVKDCIKEISLELRASDLTPDIVIDGLNDIRKLCIKGKKKDLSSAVRIHELYGKYLKMWADSVNNITLVNVQGNQFSLADRVKKLKEGKE